MSEPCDVIRVPTDDDYWLFSICFYLLTKSLLLGMKCVYKHQDLQKFVLRLNKYE